MKADIDAIFTCCPAGHIHLPERAGFPLTLTALAEAHHICPLLAERQAQLSGGLSGRQQKMVAIGHGLMAQPKSILIDEMSLRMVF